ncbi:MAG: hypothetical protein Q7U38_07330 [Methylobacter sp.]|nr:hypothetical protein [Methylobacter sp.]MDP2099407.1 hypothetical protein [Methylobacter sp.]MDP2429912.1 hypothetical protein [Methylobacter sp.]MDP3053175.1 hypothetical protein [Methylobacter sp.]MDP3360560.1 hypothetical protein [Methylobacter sp.]
MALVCKIELCQTKGITLTVINKDGKITQTATFDGTDITLTCKGENDTSTITQKTDSITVDCKDFIVNAESITCKSTKDTLHEATGTFTINSTKKATFKSSVDMDVTAATKLNLEATDFVASASNSAKVTALTSTLNGDNKANVTGLELALTGTTNASLKGAMVKVAADTTMNVEGLTTTVKGQLTNIQGSLVKLG